jgi:hypothetical protein
MDFLKTNAYLEDMDRNMTDTPSPASPQTQTLPEEKAPDTPEIGGPKGPEPTRFGDWERNGRCTDF